MTGDGRRTAARWRRNPAVLWRRAPGYLVLARVDGPVVEAYGPAGDAWAALAEWTTEDELTTALATAYAADPQVVAADLRTLLAQLDRQGLVERQG